MTSGPATPRALGTIVRRLLPARLRALSRRGLRALAGRPRPLAVPPFAAIEAAIARLPAAPIPRVIHQIWLGPERPPLRTIASCRQVNPGWLHVLWTEANMPPLRNRAAFDAMAGAYHGKADVLRYELLHRFGGVYVDADQLCLRPFDDLAGADDTFFAGFQNLGNPDLDDARRETALIANAVVGAAPSHPILARVIRDIGGQPPGSLEQAWRSVGPLALTRAITEMAARAVIHPFHAFYPYHFTEPIPARPQHMLKAMHYRSHSVSLWGTTLDRYVRIRPLPGLPAAGRSTPRALPAGFAERHPRLTATVFHG